MKKKKYIIHAVIIIVKHFTNNFNARFLRGRARNDDEFCDRFIVVRENEGEENE